MSQETQGTSQTGQTAAETACPRRRQRHSGGAEPVDAGDLLIKMGTRLKQQVDLADLLEQLEGVGQSDEEWA